MKLEDLRKVWLARYSFNEAESVAACITFDKLVEENTYDPKVSMVEMDNAFRWLIREMVKESANLSEDESRRYWARIKEVDDREHRLVMIKRNIAANR